MRVLLFTRTAYNFFARQFGIEASKIIVVVVTICEAKGMEYNVSYDRESPRCTDRTNRKLKWISPSSLE